jgi:CBS domain-containing protein
MYTVGDLLKYLKQTTLYFISAEESVISAVVYMKEKQIGAVSVRSGEDLVGILTERDVLWKCDLHEDLSTVNVRAIMTPVSDMVMVNPNLDLEECFNLMNAHRIRHLPVVVDGKQVGMLSIRDLVRAIVDQQILVSSQLESYITGRT